MFGPAAAGADDTQANLGPLHRPSRIGKRRGRGRGGEKSAAGDKVGHGEAPVGKTSPPALSPKRGGERERFKTSIRLLA